jgi:hypothetical protein
MSESDTIAEIDLGDGHSYRPANGKGDYSGIYLKHPGCKSDELIPFTSGAWAREFSGDITTWELQSEDPLTLSPSILCRACGNHGFIQGGKWVKA